jgi:hypothetical protein
VKNITIVLLLLLVTAKVQAQGSRLTGKITDSNLRPLNSLTIRLLPTNQSVVTDAIIEISETGRIITLSLKAPFKKQTTPK